MMVKTEMIRFGENSLLAIRTEMIYCSLGGNITVGLVMMPLDQKCAELRSRFSVWDGNYSVWVEI
jgi:hypothetical protein